MNNNAIRYCKKCHCELTSNNKRKLCMNCRRARARKIGNGIKIGAGTLGMVALAFFGGKNRGSHKA